MFRSVVLSCCAALTAGAAFGVGELAHAKAALRDGLWEVARRHAAAAKGDEAKAVILASFANEGKWDEVRKALDGWKNVQGAAFDYYRAVLAGDTAGMVRLLRTSGEPSALVDALMLEADLQVREGRREEAEKTWRAVVAQSNASVRAFALASANLGDAALLRQAHARATEQDLKTFTALRLGMVLVREPATEAEGEKIIRAVVRAEPDADGAREAFLSLAAADVAAGRWKEAAQAYHDAAETWPDVVKTFAVQNGRGWALLNLGRRDEALEAFRLAEGFAQDDESRASALLKQGDVLSESGDGSGALALYRRVTEKYPSTPAAAKLRTIIAVRETESRGREAFRRYRFSEAEKAFAEVARLDPQRKARMDYFCVLCLYGQGKDGAAERAAMELAVDSEDLSVRADATLWLGKFLFNRGEWKTARQSFSDFADMRRESAEAPEAMLWAARAAFADTDFAGAIQTVSVLAERYPDSPVRPSAALVQGEALIELARFDEAVLVLERIVSSDRASEQDRLRAQVLRADALFAMGADNPARYVAALEAYRAVRFDTSLEPSVRISLAYKIGRALEKLKRADEAMDQYYVQVVLAYREGRAAGVRYDDEARAAFSRAAFFLADEFQSRGKEFQTRSILEHVASSDVPAAEEARKRLARLQTKGTFL